MFQTVDWTVPQLGGLLSQVCAWLLATARSCAIPSVPWPAATSIASSEPTAAISICVSSPDKPTASTSAVLTAATFATATLTSAACTRLTLRQPHRRAAGHRQGRAAAERAEAADHSEAPVEPGGSCGKAQHVEAGAPEAAGGHRQDVRTTDLPAALQPVHDAPRAPLGRGAPVGVRARARARARSFTLTTHPESLPFPGQVLQAFRRQQDGNDGLQMRRPGTSAQPSTMQNVTPEVHARPEPCWE